MALKELHTAFSGQASKLLGRSRRPSEFSVQARAKSRRTRRTGLLYGGIGTACACTRRHPISPPFEWIGNGSGECMPRANLYRKLCVFRRMRGHNSSFQSRFGRDHEFLEGYADGVVSSNGRFGPETAAAAETTNTTACPVFPTGIKGKRLTPMP